MKKLLLLVTWLFTIQCITAQNTWTQKTDFGGTARYGAVGFSIGTKGYIGTGNDGSNKKDFWEYDPAANTWTQKTDFGGTARNGAVGFSIGTKGYIGTGSDGSNKKDFWEYDPAANTWIQKADFGGTARNGAVGFSIGTKGYIGTGIDNTSYKKDFWEYDPAANTWTQKTDFGGTERYFAVGFSIGTKGYIGIGYDGNSNKKDFWEYDPAANTWTQKTDFGGTGRYFAVGFSIGTKGYIGTGYDNTSYKKDFWEYDPSANTWTQKTDFGGTARYFAVGFSIGTKGYIGTGYSGSYKKDFWEYAPGAAATAPTVTTTTASTITSTTASSGGNVTSDGGAAVTARGVAYGTTSSPTTGTSDGTGTGTFTSTLTGLTPNTLYYYRAYATNSVGTSYGTEMSFTTLVPAPPTITTFTPTSGNVGTTVTITGTNFNATAANNIVYFGAVRATVTAASSTSLTVTTPAGATYMPISVLDNTTGLTGYSSKPFVTTFTNPFGTGIPANYYKPKVDFTTGTNSNPSSVAIGDVDGDGKPDMVVANFTSNTISVFRNISSSGTMNATSFATKIDFATGNRPSSVAIGDVDGDGKPDLVVSNQCGDPNCTLSGTISVFRNTSTYGSISASSFAANVEFSAGTIAKFVAIGDVDGDGKPEIMVVGVNPNKLSIFRNKSTSGSISAASFAAKVDFTAGSDPQSVAIGDVDGDGKPDMVVANYSSNTVSVFHNTSVSGSISASSFAAKVDFATGSSPLSVAIGDVDGDGNPDMVVANSGSNSVSVFRNTSASGSISATSFAAKVDFATGSYPLSVAIGDVDGDGNPDMVVANYGSNSVSVFRNTSASGSISAASFAAKVDFTTGANPRSVAIADVDGDGIPEIAGANYGSNSVSVLQVGAPVLPTVTTTTATSITSTSTSSGGNVTSDGGSAVTARGVAYGTSTAPTTGTSDGTGAGTFTSSLTGLSPNTLYYYRAYATNSVGTSYGAEMSFTTAAATPTVTTTTATSITSTTAQSGGNVTSDGGSAVTARGVAYGTATAPTTADTKTSDGTGTGTYTSSLTGLTSNTTYYYRAYATNSAGTAYGTEMSFTTSAQCTTPSFAAAVNYGTGANPQSIAIGDVNGDGKADLAVANLSSNTVSILIGSGMGTFAAAVNYTTPSGPYSVAIGDVNGDGKADLAVANLNDNTVSVFINSGTGTFAAAVNYATGSGPRSVAIGDVNGDGKADLAVANINDNTVSVFINSGTGTFAAAVNYATGTTPYSVAIGDVNGDGKADLAVANLNDNTVSVFINSGTGTFAAAVNYTTPSGPVSVAIGDVNGDGKADLAVANYRSSTVSVFINSGTGTFAAAVNYATGLTPFSVAIGDVNGDGKADLAVANYNSNTVSVFINSGTGTFAAAVNYATGSTPVSVAIGDLNGDGKADLVVANLNSNNVSVLLNNCSAATVPTVTTTTASSIASTTASSGGNVTSDGGSAVTARGVAYGTTTAPTTAGTKTSDGTGTGTFASSLTGLTPNTLYYYRAYATNSIGTTYGTEMSFTTAGVSQITDYYRTRQSGNWNTPATWESSPDNFATPSLIVSPATLSPDFNANTITIQNTHIVTVTTNVITDQVTVNSGGALIVNPNIVLTINDGIGTDLSVSSGASMTIKSTATGTGSIGNSTTATIIGNVTVERYISSASNRAYRLLAPSVNTATSTKQFIRDNWQEGTNNPNTTTINNPVPGYGIQITGSTTGANGFDATQTGQGSVFTYNQTTPSFVPIPNTTALTFDGKTGYLVYIRGDRSIDLSSQASPLPSSNTTLRGTGSLLQGMQTYTGLASAGNFSLVTNPYASSVSWNLIYNHAGTSNATSFEPYYTYLDPNIGSRGGYVTVSDAGMVNPDPGSSSPRVPAATVDIQSGQAFFVQTKTGVSSPSLTIQESDKSTTNNIDVFRTTTPASQKFTTSLYYNDAEHGRKLADGVTSLYDATYNAAIDGNDAEEVSNFDENIAIARGDKHLSIEERPTIKASDTLSLFMSNMKQQGYELEFNPANLNPNTTAQLVDKFTGTRTSIDVTSKTVVPFTVSAVTASGASDRFYIVFAAAASLPVTISNAIFVKVYPNPLSTNVINMQLNLVKGSYTFSLTNKLGQQILNKVIQYPGGLSTQSLTPLQTLAAGVYQLRVTGNGISVTQQVLKD